MRKSKKFLCGVIIGFATFTAFTLCSACAENEDPDDFGDEGASAEKVVDIIQSGVTLDLFEQFQLTVQMKNTEGAAVWFSSDTSVATVDDNGAVYALKEGTAMITAQNGEVRDTCLISVVSSGAVPVLTLNGETVDIFLGGEYLIEPDVTYKGKKAEGATVTYEVPEGSETITVTNGLITGKNYGTAIVKVTAAWNGVESLTMEQTLRVSVKPLITSTVEEREITLYTVEELADVEYRKTAELNAKIYENGKEKAVDWTIAEGEEFVTLDGTAITAKAEGEATLKYSCQVGDGSTFEGFVRINVFMPSIELAQTLYAPRYDGIDIDKTANEGKGSYEWKKNTAYVFPAAAVFGENTDKTVVKVKDIESGEIISNEKGEVDISRLASSSEKSLYWAIYSSEYSVNARVMIADHVISTKEQFMGFMPLIKEGYVVLGDDLDFTDWKNYAAYNSRYGATSPLYGYCVYLPGVRIYPLGGRTGEYSSLEIMATNDPFTGVFDGLGHTVKGIKLMYSGIFYAVKNATLKNLAWEVGSAQGGTGLITANVNASVLFKMENVYVKFDLKNKTETSSQGAFTHGTNDSIQVKNCIFDVYDSGATDTSFSKFGMISGNTSMIKTVAFVNTYFVYNGNGTRMPTVCAGASEATEKALQEKYGKIVFATRQEYLDYLNDTKGMLDGFNGYWEISTGEPVWKTNSVK